MGSPFCGHSPSERARRPASQSNEVRESVCITRWPRKNGAGFNSSARKPANGIQKTRSPGVDPNTLTQPDSVSKKHQNQTLRWSVTGSEKPGHAAVSIPACNKKFAFCIEHESHSIDSTHFCQANGDQAPFKTMTKSFFDEQHEVPVGSHPRTRLENPGTSPARLKAFRRFKLPPL